MRPSLVRWTATQLKVVERDGQWVKAQRRRPLRLAECTLPREAVRRCGPGE